VTAACRGIEVQVAIGQVLQASAPGPKKVQNLPLMCGYCREDDIRSFVEKRPEPLAGARGSVLSGRHRRHLQSHDREGVVRKWHQQTPRTAPPFGRQVVRMPRLDLRGTSLNGHMDASPGTTGSVSAGRSSGSGQEKTESRARNETRSFQ
jgi:hypothetical protein